jgi:hypothetical protein
MEVIPEALRMLMDCSNTVSVSVLQMA